MHKYFTPMLAHKELEAMGKLRAEIFGLYVEKKYREGDMLKPNKKHSKPLGQLLKKPGRTSTEKLP